MYLDFYIVPIFSSLYNNRMFTQLQMVVWISYHCGGQSMPLYCWMCLLKFFYRFRLIKFLIQ